jgi:HD-like signal output (HDOD) protein
VGSRWLASEVPGVEKQEAYLLGLVHDLGRSVFLRAEAVEPELLRGMSGELLAYDQLAASGELITTREQALLGFDHAVVGGEAAARIGLSERLAGLIRDHHEETSEDPDLLAVVQLADAISVHAHARPDLFERPDRATLERCYPKRWQDPAKRRIDVDRLALLVPRILAESRRLTADLG